MKLVNWRVMNRLFCVLALFASAESAIASDPPKQQVGSAEGNRKALANYMQPYRVTKLDWQLLQFNLIWSGSYTRNGTYLESFPVIFDSRKNRFHAVFGISEVREYQDPEPWSKLSKVRRQSVLQAAVDNLQSLLFQEFPEIRTKSELLYVEFKYRPPGGASVVVARIENGILMLVD